MHLDDTVSLIGGGRLGPGLSNDYDCNVYLIRMADQAWLVDTGCGLETERLLEAAALAADGLRLSGALITHAHPDHAGGARAMEAAGLRLVSGPETGALLARADPEELGVTAALRAGLYPEDFQVAPTRDVPEPASALPDVLRRSSTPGHSKDHGVYLLQADRRYLFTGDLVFRGGRVAALAGSDPPRLHASLVLARALEPDVLLPGHGSVVMSSAHWHLDQAIADFERGRLPANLT